MSQFKLFTVYKSDGTTQPLYGKTIQEAMDSAGWNLDYVSENVRDYREGFDNSLEFINGKWHARNKPEVKVKIEQEVFNQN